MRSLDVDSVVEKSPVPVGHGDARADGNNVQRTVCGLGAHPDPPFRVLRSNELVIMARIIRYVQDSKLSVRPHLPQEYQRAHDQKDVERFQSWPGLLKSIQIIDLNVPRVL
jgi:hypothetical protein